MKKKDLQSVASFFPTLRNKLPRAFLVLTLALLSLPTHANDMTIPGLPKTAAHVHPYSPSSKPLILPIGGFKDFYVSKNGPVRIGKRSVLTAVDLGDRVRVFAKKEGESSLIVGAKSFQVSVVSPSILNSFNQLYELTSQMLGPTPHVLKDQIIISGHLYRYADWERLAELSTRHNLSYQLKVRLDHDVQDEFLTRIHERLRQSNLPAPLWSWQGPVTATFSQDLKAHEETLKNIFAPYGITVRFEKAQITTLPLVRVQIVVAEVSRTLQKKIGIEWPQSTAAQLSPSLKGPEQLQVFLHALEEDGLGQILASPTLLARSGGQSEFLAGGEIPIRVSNRRQVEVIWKKHGIYLRIQPQADLTGRLKLSLTTEVSMLSEVTVDGIPGMKTNRVSSEFDLEEPRTIILSGLIRADQSSGTQGIPGLKHIPILGHLFSSRMFLESQSELVIFVTPQVLQPTQQPPAPEQNTDKYRSSNEAPNNA